MRHIPHHIRKPDQAPSKKASNSVSTARDCLTSLARLLGRQAARDAVANTPLEPHFAPTQDVRSNG
jgi:hypothetical protein